MKIGVQMQAISMMAICWYRASLLTSTLECGQQRISAWLAFDARIQPALRCGTTCEEERVDVVDVSLAVHDDRSDEGQDDYVCVCVQSQQSVLGS